MAKKTAQMNVTVTNQMKWLYDAAARKAGFEKARLAAAGFLLVMESPALRQIALDRLEEFETKDYAGATEEQVGAYAKQLRDASTRDDFERRLRLELQIADGRSSGGRPRAPKAKTPERY